MKGQALVPPSQKHLGVWLEACAGFTPPPPSGPGTHWGPWTPGLHRHRPDWKSQWPLPQSTHTNAQSSP